MRILGIDIGSSSIKAVETDSAFGRFDIHDYHEYPIHPNTPVKEIITQLLDSLAKKPDRIIACLPTSQTTFRNLVLPTKDKKAIQAAVSFELEDELPFPLEESLYDFSILSQTKNSSVVHIGATLKRYFISRIQSWEKEGIDPDAITSEVWAFRTLLNKVLNPTQQKSPTLLIQIGYKRTLFYLHWQGTPTLIREMNWGGLNLTQEIQKKFSIPLEQAEAAKQNFGLTASSDTKLPFTENPLEFVQCLEQAFDPLLIELRQLEVVCKKITQLPLSLILLSGGTSLLPGLPQWMSLKLNTSTEPFLALSSITSSGVTYSDQTDARFMLATALTLTLVGAERNIAINFRKGEFTKESRTREINLHLLKKPILAVATVTFCLFLSLFVQSNIYKKRLATTNSQLEKGIRSFFGQVSSSAIRTYLINTPSLKNSIQRELTKQRELGVLFGPNPFSPLDILNKISATIPKTTVVDMIQFQAGTPPSEPFSSKKEVSTSLTFLISNPQTAEKLNLLLNSRLASLQRGKMEEVPLTGSLKKWKISFSGNPIEEAYGK